jgi:hypothetical protein
MRCAVDLLALDRQGEEALERRALAVDSGVGRALGLAASLIAGRALTMTMGIEQ